MQRANLSPIYPCILLFFKGSHVNFKVGNVWNGPNQLLLLKLILNTIKRRFIPYIYTYIYGILRKLNSLISFFFFLNKSRIVKSRAGMILNSKLIFGFKQLLIWFYWLYRRTSVLGCGYIKYYLTDGGKWQRTDQNPSCGVSFSKEKKTNEGQYYTFPNPSTCTLRSCSSGQPFQFNTLVLG